MDENFGENNITKNLSKVEVINVPQNQIEGNYPKKKKFSIYKVLLFLVGALFFAGIGAFGAYFWINEKLTKVEDKKVETSPAPISENGRKEVEEINKWKVYRNEEIGFEFEYFNEFVLENMITETSNEDPEVDLSIKKDSKILASFLVHKDKYKYRINSSESRIINLDEWMKWNRLIRDDLPEQECNKKTYGILNGYECSYSPYGDKAFVFISKYNERFIELIAYGLDYVDEYVHILSTFKFSKNNGDSNIDIEEETSKLVETGASLTEIKYTLPNGWGAKLDDNSLYISPGSGGYLSIKILNYSGDQGRREFYCQTTGYCIDGITKFTAIKIGNISGYETYGIDNSGGGTEYFGTKGDKFYIISTYSPSYPNTDFDNGFQSVLDSLVF